MLCDSHNLINMPVCWVGCICQFHNWRKTLYCVLSSSFNYINFSLIIIFIFNLSLRITINLFHGVCRLLLICFHPDVGVCTGSLGGSSGTVQMGQTCPGYPRFSGTFAPVNCSFSWPHQIGRMSGAATEGRAAGASHSTTLHPHVFLPWPRCPYNRQLDGQLGEWQRNGPQQQEGRICLHNNYIQYHQPKSR